jgi:hypothetical protein
MAEECNFTTPEGGGVQEVQEPAQQVEQIEQQEQQEQPQQEQEKQNEQETPEPVSVKFMKMVRYLPEAFQIYMPNGWIMKAIVDNKKAIDCKRYQSRSGLTFNGCYKYVNNELIDIRGLYIVEAPELDVSTRAKLTRDWTELDEFIKSTMKLYGLYADRLISYNNWGFSVFDIFKKAPTLSFEQVLRQGHLYVFHVPAPRYVEEMEETTNITIYNHQITFSKIIKATQLTDMGTGVVYLVYAPELLAFKTISPDHGEADTSLSKGWYLFVHKRPAGSVD